MEQEWIEAVKALTKSAWDQSPGTWEEFRRLATFPQNPEEVANGRAKYPTRQYAYVLCKCIREHKLLPSLPKIVDWEGLRLQFDSPSPSDEDKLNSTDKTPEQPKKSFLEAMALNDSGIDRATKIRGRYVLFLTTPQAEIALYHCVLFKRLGEDGTPRFSMWRENEDGDRREYVGAYFVNDRQLFLLGGRPGVVDLRSSIFSINHEDENTDFEGVSLLASSDVIAATKSYLARHRITHEIPDRLVTIDEVAGIDAEAHRYLKDGASITQTPTIKF